MHLFHCICIKPWGTTWARSPSDSTNRISFTMKCLKFLRKALSLRQCKKLPFLLYLQGKPPGPENDNIVFPPLSWIRPQSPAGPWFSLAFPSKFSLMQLCAEATKLEKRNKHDNRRESNLVPVPYNVINRVTSSERKQWKQRC